MAEQEVCSWVSKTCPSFLQETQGPTRYIITNKGRMVSGFIVPSCARGEAAFSQHGVNLSNILHPRLSPPFPSPHS